MARNVYALKKVSNCIGTLPTDTDKCNPWYRTDTSTVTSRVLVLYRNAPYLAQRLLQTYSTSTRTVRVRARDDRRVDDDTARASHEHQLARSFATLEAVHCVVR